MSVGFLVQFVNNTAETITLNATVQSGDDWESKTELRPDKNIVDLVLQPYSVGSTIHEERHDYRRTAPFTITAVVAGESLSFELDGCDAENMASRGVIPIAKGSSEYTVIQVTSSAEEANRDLNTMTLFITPHVDTRRWMARLQDRTLTEITVPGTHNTGTYGGNGEMGTRCQTMDLRAQLEAGIRFLDMRLVWNPGANPHDIGVFHAAYFQNLWLGKDILPVIAQFLADHPDECVIFCANRAGDQGEPFDEKLKELFDAHIASRYDDNSESFQDKKLSEFRGKVVVLRRSRPVTWGLQAMPWPDDGADDTISPFAKDGEIRLQDAYEYGIERLPSLTYAKKWNNVKAHLERALDEKRTKWFLNFTSASHSPPTALFYPWDFATGAGRYGVNYLLSRYLVTRVSSTGSRLGTILMDFPEEPADKSLIRLLLAMNVS